MDDSKELRSALKKIAQISPPKLAGGPASLELWAAAAKDCIRIAKLALAAQPATVRPVTPPFPKDQVYLAEDAFDTEPIPAPAMTANDMLRHVVASLKGYPNAGGDIEVMAEVERIVAESKTAPATSAERWKCGEAREKHPLPSCESFKPEPDCQILGDALRFIENRALQNASNPFALEMALVARKALKEAALRQPGTPASESK